MLTEGSLVGSWQKGGERAAEEINGGAEVQVSLSKTHESSQD